MRRFLTVPTAILMLVFLISGCTSSDTAATEETTATTEAPATTAITEAPATTAAPGATVVAAVTTTAPSGGDDSKAAGLPPEVEAEVNALIEAWFEAWREGDGQAAVDLFTEDGRYVSPGLTFEGVSGEDLKAKVERAGGWKEYPRTGTPLISWRDNSEYGRPNTYYAVEMLRDFPEMPRERFELYNIVDENGTLKFRYVEGWAPLGWVQLSEDSPYTAVGDPDY